MRKGLKIIAAATGCTMLGLGGATPIVDPFNSPEAIAQDPTKVRVPQGPVHVAPQVDRRKGPPLGIANYRSQDGKRCFVEGRVYNGKLVTGAPAGGDYTPKPLDETALCQIPGSPLALSMGEDDDDPSRVIVSGLVPPETRVVEVRTSEGRASAQPDDDAFMVSVPAGLTSEGQVRAIGPDGSVVAEQTLQSRPAPDADEALRRAKEKAEDGHEGGHAHP